ncbi:MAG: divalent metal cation transporter [Planctomycetes bacterium]|nr:divalent metal cation transporter [Planctomycetota bacterium]
MTNARPDPCSCRPAGDAAPPQRGLPMFCAADADAVARERAELAALDQQGLLTRFRWYLAKSGPGWMQSAQTLGAGSATASLFAGAYLQYDLLWVQPVAMLLGVTMMMAMSHQVLSTGMRPLAAFKTYLGPAVAYIWVAAALLVTLIWHFPQYALAAGMTEDMLTVATGWKPETDSGRSALLLGIAGCILAAAAACVWNYARGRKGIRLFEAIFKLMVWMVILAFAAVVIRLSIDGRIDWARVARGYAAFHVPRDEKGFTTLMGALSAAVGVNMTFLFPYTLLARCWGREHRGLSRFDLVTGMFIPYSVATSLMVIAAGATLYDPQRWAATAMSAKDAAAMIEASGLPTVFSRFVLGFGFVGMAFNAITMHMLVSGFAACELFGIEPGGWKYRAACLLPVPGIFGAILWKTMGPWIGVPASALSGLMLPIAYVSFFILQNRRAYLGADKPRGAVALVWNLVMLAAIVLVTANAANFIYMNRAWIGKILGAS